MMKRILLFAAAYALLTGTAAAQEADRIPAKGFAVFSADDTFHPYEFTRRVVGDNDIRITSGKASLFLTPS